LRAVRTDRGRDTIEPMPDAPIRRHAIVSGRVQGVFFRDSTAQRARALGVSGWVRNRSDGTVEAVLEGPAAAVQEMLQFLGDGPPDARVGEVVATEEPTEGLSGFEIR
jgi:acylphosphatase